MHLLYNIKGGAGRGQGEQFNKHGRVNWSLARRLHLLEKVQLLGKSLGRISYHSITLIHSLTHSTKPTHSD